MRSRVIVATGPAFFSLLTSLVLHGCDALLDIRNPDGHLSDASVDTLSEASIGETAPDDAAADVFDAAIDRSAPVGSDAGEGGVEVQSPDGAIADAAPDSPILPGGFWSPNPLGTTALFFADVTGDGLADLVGTGNRTVVVWPSNGERFVQNDGVWLDAGLPITAVSFADVTGDHRADAIEALPDAIYVFPSLGSSFGPGVTWALASYEGTHATVGCSNTQFADVNGDGKADLLAIDVTGVMVSLSSGTAFAADAGNWTQGAWWGDYDTAFAPVRVPGVSDAIVANTTGIHLLPSTGHSFDWGGDGAAGGPNYNEVWSPSGVFAGPFGTYFVDVSGDGRADAIEVGLPTETVSVGNVGVYVVLSSGSNFPLPPGQTTIPEWASADFSQISSIAFADVNGDKCADFIAVYPGGVNVALSDCATAFVNQ